MVSQTASLACSRSALSPALAMIGMGGMRYVEEDHWPILIGVTYLSRLLEQLTFRLSEF